MMIAVVATWTVFTGNVAQAQGPPEMTPPHKILAKEVGVWNAVVVIGAPDAGGQPITNRGMEVNRLMGGGQWLVSDFQSGSDEHPGGHH